jgi:hypothetical protein
MMRQSNRHLRQTSPTATFPPDDPTGDKTVAQMSRRPAIRIRLKSEWRITSVGASAAAKERVGGPGRYRDVSMPYSPRFADIA